LVLVAGSSGATALSDTWTWNGQEWAQVPSGALPARQRPSVAWNPGRRRLMLFGGSRLNVAVGDTWEWNGTEWQLSPMSGPEAVQSAALTFSSHRQAMLLYGGNSEDIIQTSALWEFTNDGAWRYINGARDEQGMLFKVPEATLVDVPDLGTLLLMPSYFLIL